MANLRRPGNGGPGRGGGRKTKTQEEKIIKLAVGAIEQKYGNLEQGFVALLDSGEPALIKFVFEHAVGKPKERIEKTVDHVHTHKVGYGDQRDESDEIEDAEVVDPEPDIQQRIELPKNEV